MNKVTFDLDEPEVARVQTLADDEYDGNFSMALRKIIKEWKP